MTALATALSEAVDPVVLARRIGLEPDPWQAEVLRSAERRLHLLASRQAGKSAVVSLLAVHRAIYAPGSLVLVTAPSQRQAMRLFRSCLQTYRALGRPVPSESENALSMTLENGSEIVALPGDSGTIRGYSAVSLLIIDEAAWVPDELYEATVPMLAVSNGQLVLMSTPNGRRGFFYEIAAGDDRRWKRYKITADQCPRISREFLDEERQAKGPHVFRQEYMCEFVSAAGSLFDPDDLAAIRSAEFEPLDLDVPRHALRVVSS